MAEKEKELNSYLAAVGEAELKPKPDTLTLTVEVAIPYCVMREHNRVAYKDLIACEVMNIADGLMQDAMRAYDAVVKPEERK